MFRNVGRKLQGLAKFVCWVGIILSVLIGVMMLVAGSSVGTFNYNGVRVSSVSGVVAGLLTIVIGSLASWISSWLTYGVGLAAEYAEKHMND